MRVDLFPHTPGYDLLPCTIDIQAIVSSHVETVVLLSKGMVDNKKVKVDFSLEDMGLSELQPKCTPEKEEAIMQAFKHFGII